MSAEGYADFLKVLGHRVIRSSNLYWFDSHSGIYMSFPFNLEIDPGLIKLSEILNRRGIVARFSCPIALGRSSYRISVNDSNYSLGSLNSKSRNQTRRGLENCNVRELTNDEILEDALRLNEETLLRQGRTLSESDKSYWKKYYEEVIKAEGATIWGAFVNEELAAFLISFHMNHCENILIVRSRTSLLKYYPNNALLYDFVYQMIRLPDVEEISIGLESIQSDMDSLDRFKTGMGFQKIPIGQYVALHPFLSFILRGWVIKSANKLLRPLAVKKEKIAKLHGLLKWYEDQQQRGK